MLRTAEREGFYQWVGPPMDVETALYSANTQQRALDEMNRDGRLEQLKQRWLSDNTPR